MTWTHTHYPAALARLEENIRAKAISMANALAAQGFTDQEAVRIALGRVEMWRTHRARIEAEQKGLAQRSRPLPTSPPNPPEKPRRSPPPLPRDSLPPPHRR